jgi:hypothetical protein
LQNAKGVIKIKREAVGFEFIVSTASQCFMGSVAG